MVEEEIEEEKLNTTYNINMMINLLLAQAGSIIPGEKRGRVNRIFILLTLTL